MPPHISRAALLLAGAALAMACGISTGGLAPLEGEGGATTGEAESGSSDGPATALDASTQDAWMTDGDSAGSDGAGNAEGSPCGLACVDAANAGPEGGPLDAGSPDAAGPDAAGPDAAGPDTGAPDTGGPDAGPDAATCGVSCDTASGSPTCQGNTCRYVCNPGLADCNSATAPDTDGCETLLSSTTTCGACGNACNTSTGTPSCNGATCSYACNAGRADCNSATAPDTDGCETSLSSTTTCGGCGNACNTTTGTPSCNGTACSYVCKSGLGDCNKSGPDLDGCETPVTTAANCGTCGNSCSGACVTHSGGLGASYWSCLPLNTHTQAEAMNACLDSGHGGCAVVTTTCGDSGSESAVCSCPGFFGTEYCWVYSGVNAGRAFSGLAVLACSACPTGATQPWN